MQTIKAILFDLDGTLKHHFPSGGEVFVARARSMGLRISEDDKIRGTRWEHFYFASSPEIQADSKAFKNDSAGFWVNFTHRHLVALGTHSTQAAELAPSLSTYMSERYKPAVYVPQEARLLLEDLKNAGYILGMVSNRDKPIYEELKSLDLDSYFSFALVGGEVDSYKPDTLIFERALELAGTSAEETLYVGDNYFADVVGAQRAGLTPVLYDPVDLFPEADCAVIRSFAEFLALLPERANG